MKRALLFALVLAGCGPEKVQVKRCKPAPPATCIETCMKKLLSEVSDSDTLSLSNEGAIKALVDACNNYKEPGACMWCWWEWELKDAK